MEYGQGRDVTIDYNGRVSHDANPPSDPEGGRRDRADAHGYGLDGFPLFRPGALSDHHPGIQ